MTPERSATVALSRRQLCGLVGTSLLGGCAALPRSEPPERLPVLMEVQSTNSTSSAVSLAVRVKRAANLEQTPETVFTRELEVPAKDRVAIRKGWEKTPSHYALEYSVDGGDWRQSDIAHRLTQAERICYYRRIMITSPDDSAGVATETYTNLDAACPEGVERTGSG